MKGAQLVVEAIRREGIQTIFGYPGGAIMPVYDALVGSGLRHILVRHEQAAGHAAEGFARVSGKPGVALVTSGPGATNLVTALADAQMDSIPVVAITGQVATSLMGTDAFQEVDAYNTIMPVVKHSFKVMRPEKLAESLWLAFRIATTGRHGPVHIDIPKDIQNAECPDAFDHAFASKNGDRRAAVDAQAVEHAARILRDSKRPLLYVGGGVHYARAVPVFRKMVDQLRAPMVSTLKGLGALPPGHPLMLGMMGMHGSARANRALKECDVLFAVGARFDDRATGKLKEFCSNAKVIHFDIDAAEVGKLRQPDVSVVGSLRDSLPMLMQVAERGDYWHPEPPDPPAPWDLESPCPRDILQAIDADVVTTDVGQHQMWAAQFLNFNNENMQLLTSGGLGTMGFGLPAAIGAQFANPKAKVACVTGDGSLMMLIHEFATLHRYNLPVKIFLFENQCLGMVRQWQELFFENRESEVDLSDNPDFTKVAEAFRVRARRVTKNAEVVGAVREAMAADGPYLVQFDIERTANVWPLVPPGKANHEYILGHKK